MLAACAAAKTPKAQVAAFARLQNNNKEIAPLNTTLFYALLILSCISYTGGFVAIYLVGLKKWWVWLFYLVGFASGFFMGLLISNPLGGIKFGAIFVSMSIFSGVIQRKYHLYFKKWQDKG